MEEPPDDLFVGGSADMEVDGDVVMNATALPGSFMTLPLEEEVDICMPLYLPREPDNSEAFDLLGTRIYLAEPTKVLAEDFATVLDVGETRKARRVELDSMNHFELGKIIPESEVFSITKTHGIKPISCRWVLGPKDIKDSQGRMYQGVRARAVVQEIARGKTAQELGISSATPSCESLRAFLSEAASTNAELYSVDISTAFMHAPLSGDKPVIVRMPADMSATKLSRVMNGLEHLISVVQVRGLNPCPSEPCVLAGSWKLLSGQTVPARILVYVDDILISTTSKLAGEEILKHLASKLKMKLTGSISAAGPHAAGGRIKFLGREIRRLAGHDPTLHLRVPPDYLKGFFDADGYVGQATASLHMPDVGKLLETHDHSELSDQHSSAYRAALGKLAWYGQTRFDLLRPLSLLGQGQAQPLRCHEHALKQLLKYLKSDAHRWQSFPIPGEPFVIDGPELKCFADASWAPHELEERRSVTGMVILYKGSVVKAVSRLQQSQSQSSCEAEVIALGHAAQESLGMRHICEFLHYHGSNLSEKTLQEVHMDDSYNPGYKPVHLVTDSTAAKGLLLKQGLNRRTRHLSIGIHLLQHLLREGVFQISWVGTDFQLADALTKCLNRAKILDFMKLVGLVVVEGPEPWQTMTKQPGKIAGKQNVWLNVPCSVNLEKLSALTGAPIPERVHSLVSGLNDPSVRLVVIEACTQVGSGLGQASRAGVFILQIDEMWGLAKAAPIIRQVLQRAGARKSILLSVV